MSRILVVEDEPHIAQGIRFNLEAEGHDVDVVGDGNDALAALSSEDGRHDLVVLDVMLPGRDGFEVIAELRRASRFVPVLMLTARGRPEDVLKGFESGADDYLPKPFELQILLARVRGLLRRARWLRESLDAEARVAADEERAADEEPATLTFAGKTLDLHALELRVGDRAFHLTVMECDLLRYLLKNAGKAVSRRAILEDVWGLHEDTDTRAIDNFIVRLRRYLEQNPTQPRHLLTVRGVGYKLVAEP
ncbi:MAG: response regulator [Luteitalea sp.]|nr:response regulator [Luteitalea sp.]